LNTRITNLKEVPLGNTLREAHKNEERKAMLNNQKYKE